VIHELDLVIASIIEAGLPAMDPKPLITFAPPDSQFPPQGVTLPAIDLFLYDVRENRELRTTEPLRERIQEDGVDRWVKTRPPVRVDCSYLVTAWPRSTAPNPTEDEHRLLGEVLRVLLAHRRLPVPTGSTWEQDLPIRALPAQEGRLQSVGEFWQALGGKAKGALDYKVTISVDLFTPPVVAPTVLEKVLTMTPTVGKEDAP
jgi:hypothetical protein